MEVNLPTNPYFFAFAFNFLYSNIKYLISDTNLCSELVSEPPQKDSQMTFLGSESSQKMNFQKFAKRWTRPKYLKLADLDGSNTDSRM